MTNTKDLRLDGECRFCKGRFPIDALIAGYDTFDEQRLACLACNERMSGNWRPALIEDSSTESSLAPVTEGEGEPHRPHQGVVAPYRCNHPECPVTAYDRSLAPETAE